MIYPFTESSVSLIEVIPGRRYNRANAMQSVSVLGGDGDAASVPVLTVIPHVSSHASTRSIRGCAVGAAI